MYNNKINCMSFSIASNLVFFFFLSLLRSNYLSCIYQIIFKTTITIVDRSEGWPRPSTPLVFASINSPCVRRGHLGECIIKIRYAPFLTSIAFKRIGSTWGPTSGIRVKVTSSNPMGVVGGEIVGRLEGWLRSSTPLVFAVGTWVNAL